MRLGVTVLVVALLIAFVWVSGCQNLDLGSTQVADFGKNSADAQKVQDWFIGKYGDPAKYSGPARFLEPMVSDGVADGLPTDKVTAFSKDAPSVYAWVFYEGFKKGDQITAAWTFNGKQFASLSKPVGGNYGIVYGQFDMPKAGWAIGTHTITFSGDGAENTVTFEIREEPTVTASLPYQPEGISIAHQPVSKLIQNITDKTKNDVSENQNTGKNLPVKKMGSCLSSGTLIDTPGGPIPVNDISPGMIIWTLDGDGTRQPAPVLKVAQTPVMPNHHVIRLFLADGRHVVASAGHPTADGRSLSMLVIGDHLDRSVVTELDYELYNKAYTYDILPTGGTGDYWADGILLKSTLQ